MQQEDNREHEPRAAGKAAQEGDDSSLENGGEDESSDIVDSLSDTSEESDASDFLHVEALPKDARTWVTEQDADLERIQRLANLLRPCPRLPTDPTVPEQDFKDLDSGVALPLAHCAFRGCTAVLTPDGETSTRKGTSHVAWLQQHLVSAHASQFREACGALVPRNEFLDYYEEACKEQDRRGIPQTGVSLDRRVLAHLREVYTDEKVKTLICTVCAEKNLYLRGYDRRGVPADQGEIAYRTLAHIEKLMRHKKNDGAFLYNLDFGHFVKQFATQRPGGADSPYLEAPELDVQSWEWRRIFRFEEGDRVALCCPEDIQVCQPCEHEMEVVCRKCQLPICFDCWWHMDHAAESRIPQALANDNLQGYVHPFIVENEVRFIEAVIACPVFTSMVVY